MCVCVAVCVCVCVCVCMGVCGCTAHYSTVGFVEQGDHCCQPGQTR